jgi:hypothetical protein
MTTEDTIRALEDERYAAMLAADVGKLEGLLSDRLVYTHSTGGRDTKASYLDAVRNKLVVYDSLDHPVDQVIVAGGAAVVIGAMNARLHLRGEPRELRNNASAVWADEDGTWRLIAFQGTPQPS